MSRDRRFLLFVFLNNDIHQSQCHLYCFNNAFVSSVRYENIGCSVSWVINDDDISSGLSSMAVCFDFSSTNVVQICFLNP